MIAMRWATRICLVLLVGLTLGCASRSAKAVEPDRGAWADELVRQGCYDCLLDARTAYERLAATSAGALTRVFEVDLLLALREKELSIDPTATLAHAESLVPRLERLRPPEGATPALPTGCWPSSEAFRRMPPAAGCCRQRTTPRNKSIEALAAIDTSPFSAELKDYLRLSIQCGRTAADRVPAVPADGIPLLAYRRAICTPPLLFDRLRAVRTAVPRFVEASFFLGRVAMASIFRTDGSEVRGFFEQAYARFPNSPTIAFELGTVYQATNECRPAERLFTRALELTPAHEEARLGRAVCRTYLSQHEEAIADATVLIDARASNRAEAYYWRAWNHRHLKQIEWRERTSIRRGRCVTTRGS